MDHGMTQNRLLQSHFITGANWSNTGAVEGICSSGIYNSFRVNINHDWSSLFAEDRTGAGRRIYECKLALRKYRRKDFRSISTANGSILLELRITPRLTAQLQTFLSGKRSVQLAARDSFPSHRRFGFPMSKGVTFIASQGSLFEKYRQPFACSCIGAVFA